MVSLLIHNQTCLYLEFKGTFSIGSTQVVIVNFLFALIFYPSVAIGKTEEKSIWGQILESPYFH